MNQVAKIIRICKQCKEPFTPQTKQGVLTQIYCDAACRRKAGIKLWKRRTRAIRQALWQKDRTCRCGRIFMPIHPVQIHCQFECKYQASEVLRKARRARTKHAT